MMQNTDHIVETKLKISKRERLGGRGIRLEAHVYKGPEVIEPRKDGPIVQPAWKQCCNTFHFITFNFISFQCCEANVVWRSCLSSLCNFLG